MPINFLHSYSPHPIALQIGPIAVHWYGLLIVMAILAGYWLSGLLAKKRGLSPEAIYSVYVNMVIWGVLGARAYHVLVIDFGFYWSHPAQIPAIWNGGLAIHGAIIAGVLALAYGARKYKINFWNSADLFVIPAILGQAIGRWGNYFNQELFGRPSSVPWSIPIDAANRGQEFAQYQYFHPTFLYESLWNLTIFAALCFLYISGRRTSAAPSEAKTSAEAKDGIVFWMYIALYSVGRIGMEFVRIDMPPEIYGIRLPLAVSGILVFVGVFMVIRKLQVTSYKLQKQKSSQVPKS